MTGVDRPLPVSLGAEAVKVATVADPPARILPTVHTWTDGLVSFGTHDTPVAGVRPTVGWPATAAGRVTVILVLAWPMVPTSLTVMVEEPVCPGPMPGAGWVAETTMEAVPAAPAGGEVAKRPAAAATSTAPPRTVDRTTVVVVVMVILVVFPLCGRAAFGAALWDRDHRGSASFVTSPPEVPCHAEIRIRRSPAPGRRTCTQP